MTTKDNHNNTSGNDITPLKKITVTAEEFSNFLSSHKRKQKGLISSCIEYVNRISETAIGSDYLGLYELCAHYQERLFKIEKNDDKVSKEIREALEAWPAIITDSSLSRRTVDRLAEHLNLPCWGITISEDDIALLKSMPDFSADENPELSDEKASDIKNDPKTIQQSKTEITTDNSIEELPEAVLELVGILQDEFEELNSQLENIINSSSNPDTEIETHSNELKNYADMLKDYLDASASIGFKALAQVCSHIEANVSAISQSKRLLKPEESTLLNEWANCVITHLKSVTDEDGAASLAVALIDEEWPQPLSEDEAASLSMGLVKPELPEFEDESAKSALQAQPEDVSITIPEDVNQELLDALLLEFPDQTEELSTAVQNLIESGNQEDIKTAQRVAHTVKGAGNTVGIPGVANIAHRLEDIFLALTKHNALPPQALGEVMVNATDCLEAMSESLTGVGDAPDNALEVLRSVLDWINQIAREGISADSQITENQGSVNRDENISEKEVATEKSAKDTTQENADNTPEAMLRVPSSLIEELIRIEGEELIFTGHIHEQVHSIKNENQAMQDKYLLLQNLSGKLEELINVKDMSAAFDQHQYSEDFDSMEMDQYSELHTNVHQLIEAAVDIYEMGKSVSDQLTRLEEIIISQKKLNHDSQEVALQTRMVPAKTIFPRLKRAVRQVSKSTGKKIELHLHGEETLMVGDMLSDLVEPLMHIVRNAIDHGIEDAELRTEVGKPVEGNITVDFLRQGTDIIVRVEDDGSGLDLDRIRSAAEEKELLVPGEEVTEKTLVNMILKPNFSTRSETTQVSGRGIGMDAVNFSVNKLGGELNLESKSGKGCVMEMKIPVSLISTHILLLRCGLQVIAITINAIEQILSPEDGELLEIDGELVLQMGDDNYPVKSLASLLKIPDRRSSNRTSSPIILLRGQDGVDAVLVEGVIDSREQVVKNLGEYIPKLHGILGVTILGDGNVIPVLDLAELLRTPGKYLDSPYESDEQGGIQLPTAIVVDDSLSVRRSMTQFMEDSGYKVRAARDGIEAIDILKGLKPDILLVDMEMPRMNGIELTAYVRSQESIADVPIIMITSRSTSKHREEAKRAGIDSQFSKPFSEEALLEEIDRLRVAH